MGIAPRGTEASGPKILGVQNLGPLASVPYWLRKCGKQLLCDIGNLEEVPDEEILHRRFVWRLLQ